MAATPVNQIGKEALQLKGWLKTNKWLLLRRLSQLSILGLFLLGPWFGIWIIKGNLNSSLILDTIPLSDPYILLQTLFTGYLPQTTAILGALIVIVFYALVGSRVYCSWVCPINIVTDFSMWLRHKLNIKSSSTLSRKMRYWILAMTLIAATATGSLVWEFVNPVSMVNRALVFGLGFAWALILMIFLLDTFISRRAWCGHLCPVGAFYSLLGKFSLIRVNAVALDRCNSCMECYAVCPEQKVISPVLNMKGRSNSIIDDINCTNCGRCIDICATEVFKFDLRFNNVEKLHNKTGHRRPSGNSETQTAP
jgi:ferredoxin-type protein NapH